MNILSKKSVYCVGIGGIGVSAVARLLHHLGKKVSGSDVAGSVITDQLQKLPIKIHIGAARTSLLPLDTDLVVYSNAVPASHPILKYAAKKNIATVSYPQMLSALMSGSIPLIVSGTHGKSTTSAMLSSIFISAGLDPTVVIGTIMPELDGNARLGMGKHFIAEGDEYRAAFLNYAPIGLIINNIEADHLDYYKTESAVVRAFSTLAKKVPPGGIIVANAQDTNVILATKKVKGKILTFGMGTGDYYINHVIHHGELTRFAVRGFEEFEIAIRVPGTHNMLNALAATVMAIAFGIPIPAIQKGLLGYHGIWRRFEIKGERSGKIIVDDYAHHPTEIKATLVAAREYFPKKKIWCVFQPHSTHRTKSLYNNFVSSFEDCDQLILTDVYRVAGRETQDAMMMKKMATDIKPRHPAVRYKKTFAAIARTIQTEAQPGDVIITMGAGTITELSDMLLKKLP